MVRLQRGISLSIAKMLVSSIGPINNFFLCNYNLSEELEQIWGDKLLTNANSKSPIDKKDLNKSMNRKAVEWVNKMIYH